MSELNEIDEALKAFVYATRIESSKLMDDSVLLQEYLDYWPVVDKALNKILDLISPLQQRIAELQARIDELEHKNEVLMDSYLESETINDKGELVGSLEHFRQHIAELESENKALRLIAGSHSMSELRRNRIMAGWRRGDTLKNEVRHE